MKPFKYKKLLIISSIACILGAGASFVLVPKKEYKGVDIKDIDFYSTPWDKEKPFFPGELATADKKMGNPKAIPSSSECVKCHKKEFEEWVPSLHSISGRDLVYDNSIEANVQIKKHHHGRELSRFCDSCHNPIEVAMGKNNPIVSVEPSDVQTEGLACIFCHTATHADAELGNGAITFDLNKAYDNLSGSAILASPKDHARAFGSAKTNELLKSAEFCGACHNERYYPPITPSNKVLKAQSTYDEWKDSWYAKNDVTCQDCHMNYEPIKFIKNLQDGIVEKPEKYSHNFWGGNHVLQDTSLKEKLLFLRGGVLPGVDVKEYFRLIDKQKPITEKFLKAAAKVEVLSYEPKDGFLEVKVKVSNVGAGHNLPTGVVDQKHMWLELKVIDSNGNVVYDNGKSDRDENVVIWAERFRDKKSKIIMDHMTFKTHDITLTRPTIAPRGHQIITYKVPLKEGVKVAKLESNLWYKIAYEELVIKTLHRNIPIPKFLLTNDTKEVK
jgi:cytochrome c551/c552